MSLRRTGWVWAFLLLPLITYAIAVVGPALYSFYYSLTDWKAVGGDSPFVGLRNYQDIGADPYFWNALTNTGLWTVVAVVVPTAVGLALALGLNRVIRLHRVIKSLFFLPVALSLVVVGQVWFWIFRPEDGLLNLALGAVGLSSWQQAWLADPDLALWAVLLAWCWQQVALSMVVFLAGLTAVPAELIEAARMDGASARQQLRHVVIPALRPAFTVVISLSVINALKSFDIIYIMTQGGPFRETETLAAFMYRVGFKTYEFGYASAVAVVLFVLTLVTIGLFFGWMNRKEKENG
ncbi:sugar ABC transporter permease [Streptomyces sp. AJS327]|uniref:carbohydrate ABC transporter permease n=1 Tax=Streptomyces sp. AJS327 TaxID=2545265 RepID=UPI0015DDEB9C|nr:sugar ABC transporter permease [Streptomyces sp. AJS327]MBA0051273.1 sugar ABC transporter permease [Streptomyces sp. AJS327]